jgi:hypothetical protein
MVAALVLAAAASQALAADLQDIYFAYSYFKAGQSGQYTLLSHRPCADKAASKRGWKQAAFTTAWNELGRACWQDASSDRTGSAVRVCMVSSADELGNACRYISKDYFSDTATLPRRPKF